VFLVIFIGKENAIAQTKEISKYKGSIKKIEQEIDFLDNQINSTAKKQKNTLEELVLIQRKVANRKRLLQEIDNEITTQSKLILKKEEELSFLKRKLDSLEVYYKRMVYNAYKNRDTKLWFMYILASENIEQGYRRWGYLKNYSKNINNQSVKIKETSNKIKEEQTKLIELKENNLEVQKSREKEYSNLVNEENQSKKYAQSLGKKQQEYKKQLAQKRREAQRLAKEVERLIEIEIKKAQQQAKEQDQQQGKVEKKEDNSANVNMLPTEYNKITGSFTANKGKLPWPVSSGVIVEEFGEHPHPTLKNIMLPFNNGINISTLLGEEVKVIFEGVVKQVIAIPGYNQCVLVQHGNYFTFYCKLASVNVKIGDKVKAGTVIGKLIEKNNTSELHFELWNGTKKQNPELWLKRK
jgi:Membrane-bound metallopeptidase